MKLAINYCPQAAELLAAGRIELDYFKTPEWPGMIADALRLRPVQVHFELRAGAGCLHTTDWPTIETFLAQTGTPYVNLHLAPLIADFPGFPAELTDPVQVQQVIETMLHDVQAMAARFGSERVIVENVPYLGPDRHVLKPAGDPGVIRRIIEETGCGLLLDLSHARIGARHLGLDEHEYIDQLPLDRLRELHFTGIHRVNGGWKDHLPILPADWIALDWALDCIRQGQWARPWLLAFEYGGVGSQHFRENSDPAVIAAQVPELYRRLQS